MVVFGAELHVLTFIISLLELVFFFYQIVYYLSRPSDKNRLYYLILLYLLIQQNIVGGLLPDKNIPIGIVWQNIFAFIVSIAMAMYFPYYFYKVFKLNKLKFYAYWGSVAFILIPFIVCFLIPYYLTKNLELCRRIVVIVPFFYALSFIYSLAVAITAKTAENKDATSKKEIVGMYVAVIFWCTLPIIAFFETNLNDLLMPVINFHNGSQLVEVVFTNAGLLAMTLLFIRRSVEQSRKEYTELLELNAQLTVKVLERTKDLEIAHEQRTNTFINLAHETKTPLTLINNYLHEYINTHGETDDLAIIKCGIEKLSKDIVNFFDLERIKRGLPIYGNEQITDFSGILRDNIVLFKKYASRKNIELTEYIEDGGFVKADPGALYRIFNNLIENAIKYTGEGGKIEVALKFENNKANFTVTDNGIGIPSDVHSKVFEPYYQINSEKKNFQGMGMGLSIVKKIVDGLGGGIILLSDRQKKTGTEITVQLPLHERINGEIISDFMPCGVSYFEVEKLYAKDEVQDEERPIIMLVEDNITLLNFMTERLKEKYNIYVAVNGTDAMKKLKSVQQLDLIVSDVMMDQIDGFELCKSISGEQRLRHIPFIFLSVRNTTEDKIHGLSLGAIDYIPKPFLIGELINKIDSVLNNLQQQRMAIMNNLYKTLLHQNAPEPLQNESQTKFENICLKFNLTFREIEIVRLIAKGRTYKEIANALSISDRTVARHVQNIFEKSTATNKVELLNKLGFQNFAN